MATWEPEIVEIVGRMPYSSNATLLGQTDDGEFVIYKPERGERPLWDFDSGTLSIREALAYEISHLAGLGIVPETVLADGPFGPGAIQRFIEEDLDFDPAPPINGADPALWPFAVLDLVINNADRKAGHILRETGSQRLWSIDHGITLHDEPKLRTVLWCFSATPLPDDMVSAVEKLSTALDDGFRDRVASLLTPREAEALSTRVGMLLANPVHPTPPHDRPAMPWPIY